MKTLAAKTNKAKVRPNEAASTLLRYTILRLEVLRMPDLILEADLILDWSVRYKVHRQKCVKEYLLNVFSFVFKCWL